MADDPQTTSSSAPAPGGLGALKWALLGAGVFVVALIALCVMLMRPSPKATGASLASLPVGYVANASTGAKLYMQSCASCHGPRGHGMPHQGLTIRQSVHVSELTDLKMVEFLRVGRAADHPDSAMKLPMPAKGNNPNLTDVDLMDVVAHMRALQAEAGYVKTR